MLKEIHFLVIFGFFCDFGKLIDKLEKTEFTINLEETEN